MPKLSIFWSVFSSAAVSLLFAWIFYTPSHLPSFEILFLASFLGMLLMDGLIWSIGAWRKRRAS